MSKRPQKPIISKYLSTYFEYNPIKTNKLNKELKEFWDSKVIKSK